MFRMKNLWAIAGTKGPAPISGEADSLMRYDMQELQSLMMPNQFWMGQAREHQQHPAPFLCIYVGMAEHSIALIFNHMHAP
jgi:hypothetical protein